MGNNKWGIEMSIFNFLKYKNTDFGAGGLHLTKIMMTAENSIQRNPKFIAPRKIDCRDYCIETSNQFNTPHCAGYATAGLIEVKNWKINHYPEQIDGDAIYYEAKRFDNMSVAGTTLEQAARAAINLGLVSGDIKFISNDMLDIMFTIHTNQVFVGGFSITDEWNRVSISTGEISDFGENASVLGGHAVLVCGYDPTGVYVQNSWGQPWGKYGFGLIPWAKVSKQFMYGVIIS